MSDRLERLTNLVTLLLTAEHAVSLREIADRIEGYPPGEVARRRAFERDKALLREEGIPLIEEGGFYRIPPEEYYLPELDLSPDERIALNAAVAAVAVDEPDAEGALRKLGGVERSNELLGSRLQAELDELPVLPLLHQAARTRATVAFTYGGDARDVEPWGLLFRDGNWYVIGFDRTRQDRRNFRADRIEGEVTVGAAGSFEPPPDLDLRTAIPRESWRIGGDEVDTARVEVDALLAAKVEAELGADAVVERRDDGSVVVALRVTNRSAFRSWLLGLLEHAVLLEPAELRSDVVEWLEAIAAS